MDGRKISKPVKKTQVKQKSSSKKRRERKAMSKNSMNNASGPKLDAYPHASYSNTGIRARSTIPRRMLTPGGEAFLKCAFAPPDFAASNPSGVPDNFRGVSLLKKHRFVGTYTCNVAATDYYIVMIPSVGGTAYWGTTVAANTPILESTPFYAAYYSDTASLFPSAATEAGVFTKYRYVSNHVELIPTMNQMSWSGSIQSWKAPISMIAKPGGLYTVTGLAACNATNANQYTGPTNLGIYTAAYNTGSNFDFQDIKEGIAAVPAVLVSGTDFGQLVGNQGGIDPQFESVIIKISGMGASVSNSFIIKTWACIEYQVVPGSGIYEYQTLSPCDEYAMELYRAIIMQLPIGVSFVDNENFWRRVLGIIKNVSGTLSFLPGQYGAISSGVNMIASGIDSLTL